MNRSFFISAIALLLSLPAFSVTLEDSTKSKESEKTLNSATKGHRKIDGLFTLYLDTAKGGLKMFIDKDKIGQEFIYQSFSIGGPSQLFLNQNMLRSTFVFSIERNFDKLEFVMENTNLYYEEDKALSKAKNADVSRAKFYSTKIDFEDSTGYLIDVDLLYQGQLMDAIKPDREGAKVFNLGTLNKSKSQYLNVRSFPKNTDVVVSLTFDNAQPKVGGGKYVTDARYIEVKMQHTFIAMPDNDYEPRFDDPRVGYFVTQRDNMTTYDYPRYHDLIHRWDLVKKHPDSLISEPVEPIVWWVENTTPVEYRHLVMEAGRRWNRAFEKAGFRNAVVMKMMPDTATWDPADIRYNVIRWVSSELGLAIGPSFVNPRTGQILGADITVDFGMLLHSLNEQQLFNTQFGPYDFHFDSQEGDQNHRMCSIATEKRMQHAAAVAMLQANDASEEELKRLTEEFIIELILHEMGHTLGLAHNMKASQMLSLEEAHDTSITHAIGVTASVMDYAIVNVHSDKSKQGDYYTTVPGPYDLWAIEYGYTPDPTGTILAEILNRSSDPKLDFGNDADIVSAWSGVDPRVMTWDMSSDVVEYAIDRCVGINHSVSHITARYVNDSSSYQKMLFMYHMMQRGRAAMSRATSRYIGGIYVNRNYPGQTSSTPYTVVPEAYQRSAMQFLREYIFAPDAFAADEYIYPYLQPQRRGWNFYGRTEDPKIQNLVLGIQMNALDYIVSPTTLNRITNTSLYGNTYTVDKVLADLVAACFEDDWSTEVNIFRQNLQTELVKKLIVIALNEKGKFDNASQAAAISELDELEDKLEKKRGKKGLTRNHRTMLRFMIEKALGEL